EVNEPGIRYANATGRVSDVLEQSGGLTDWANDRAIEIRHADGTVDHFNGWKYNNEGGLENNPLLRDGDEVFVPGSNFSQGILSVRSPVNRIGFYQYYQEESVFEFLKRNNFGTINMDFENVTVERTDGTGEITTYFITLNTANPTLTSFILQSDDVVVMPIFETVVYVDGEVVNPGSYPWIAERSAGYYVSVAGRTTDASDKKKIIVTRKNEKFYGEEIIIEIGDQIHMPKKRHLVVRDWLEFLSPIVSILLAAKAINIF
ncbi:MAG: SLBB domain-containing protein, partial [Proteobacteria bacterium]|nr:SLBB domain-containing protein [Pseudomonadota bacterium]